MKKGFFVLSLFSCSYLFYVFFFYSSSVSNYYEKKKNLYELEYEIHAMEHQNQKLELLNQSSKKYYDQKRLIDMGYIEKNKTILEIRLPELNTSSQKRIVVEKLFSSIFWILFFSFLTLFFILFLILKYQRRVFS